MENTAIALPLALALELSPGTTSTALTLNRDQSAELAALIATDLYQLLPTANKARLSVVGALFDMVELLRPGFMVWDALSELARRVPRGRLENVVAFGHHEGRMPMPVLEPDARHANGAMRLLPLSLLAPVACAPTLGSQLEATLMAQGQAGTRSADFLMRSLGLRLEHARYLTRNDLLALGCVQYEHANLAGLWQLLETALLTPSSE